MWTIKNKNEHKQNYRKKLDTIKFKQIYLIDRLTHLELDSYMQKKKKKKFI